MYHDNVQWEIEFLFPIFVSSFEDFSFICPWEASLVDQLQNSFKTTEEGSVREDSVIRVCLVSHKEYWWSTTLMRVTINGS